MKWYCWVGIGVAFSVVIGLVLAARLHAYSEFPEDDDDA